MSHYSANYIICAACTRMLQQIHISYLKILVTRKAWHHSNVGHSAKKKNSNVGHPLIGNVSQADFEMILSHAQC